MLLIFNTCRAVKYDRTVRINRYQTVVQLKELIAGVIGIVPEEFRLRR